jgi:hypothetical protein
MPANLISVIVGGAIGIISSITTTMTIQFLTNRKRAKAIKAIASAEIVAIKEKAERYMSEKSSKQELTASTPMLTSIATELGFLTKNQVICLRRAVTLDMELRKEGNKEKAEIVVQACQQALKELSVAI